MRKKRNKFTGIDIAMIIIGVCGTFMLLMGVLISVAVMIAAPLIGKFFGAFFALAMIALIIGLWVLILD